MILACNNISKSFVDKVIIEKGSFHIEEREKAAIVGINGAGKTTLLKIIMGLVSPDSGDVILAKGKTIGYLAQHQDLTEGNTIYTEMLTVKQDVIRMEEQIRQMELDMKHASGDTLKELLEQYTRLNHQFEQMNGYAYKSEINGVLKGLGFQESEFDMRVETLSGGQKTRLSLSKLLLSHPDVVLLDEPTNHLDVASITWLENFLTGYAGSVIIVSHDRYFLDRIVTKVIEIDNKTIRMYTGNYTAYSEKKKAVMDALLKQYENQQREIKHQEAVIAKLKSFNREKSIKRAESREKMLDKMEIMEKPTTDVSSMNIRLEPNILSGNDVLSIEGLSKSYGQHVLFRDAYIEIKRGERVAVIGNNGTGKTTLLKIINGLETADCGTITLGSKVHIGYYDQEHHVLHMEKTLFEEISDAYPNLTNTQIRNVLAAFLFTGDDVFKRVSELSGGERGRVSLAKLMLSDSNFLILDEPTNHLDMMSKEILEQALNRYTGTILYVSHDRYFINKTATRILELTNQNFINYIGNYDYYLEKKDILSAPGNVSAETSDVSSQKIDWKRQKEEQAQIRKRQNELKKTEDAIAQLEDKISSIDELLSDPAIATNIDRLLELDQEKQEAQSQLDVLYERWEELAE